MVAAVGGQVVARGPEHHDVTLAPRWACLDAGGADVRSIMAGWVERGKAPG
jgi:hypothetical protein